MHLQLSLGVVLHMPPFFGSQVQREREKATASAWGVGGAGAVGYNASPVSYNAAPICYNAAPADYNAAPVGLYLYHVKRKA